MCLRLYSATMLAVRMSVLLLWLVVIAVPSATGDDDEQEVPKRRGLKVFVSKKGARIRLFRELPLPPTPKSPNPTGSSDLRPPLTGQITITFEGLKEVDADGNPVSTQGGKARHAVDSLSSQDFSVTQLYNYSLPYSYNTVVADCAVVETTLTSPASHVKVMACITKSNGTVTLGDEVTQVMEGQLKFSVQIDGWQWCDSGCASGKAGAFLDLDLNFKIPPGKVIKKGEAPGSGKRPKRFSLGGGDAVADFSTKVNVDSNWKDMPEGFPLMEERGANHYITIRLPRFTSNVIYDPTVDAGYSTESTGSFHLQFSLPLVLISCSTALVSSRL